MIRRLLLLALVAPLHARNGYALQCQGSDFDFATTRSLTLDDSNPEIARLSEGVTISTWLRFDDRTPAGSSWTNYPFALANDDDLHAPATRTRASPQPASQRVAPDPRAGTTSRSLRARTDICSGRPPHPRTRRWATACASGTTTP